MDAPREPPRRSGVEVIRAQAARKLAILSGEVRCPLKAGGIIATEACVTLQDRDDSERCKQHRCIHVENRLHFADEAMRARGDDVPVRKQPVRRPWLKG